MHHFEWNTSLYVKNKFFSKYWIYLFLWNISTLLHKRKHSQCLLLGIIWFSKTLSGKNYVHSMGPWCGGRQKLDWSIQIFVMIPFCQSNSPGQPCNHGPRFWNKLSFYAYGFLTRLIKGWHFPFLYTLSDCDFYCSSEFWMRTHWTCIQHVIEADWGSCWLWTARMVQ